MRMVAPEMTEKAFQAQVEQALRSRGWLVYHTHDSRRSAPGFPDIAAVRGEELLLIELKRERGKLTVDQSTWLDALREVKRVGVHVWRPSDWPTIEKLLGLNAPLAAQPQPDRMSYREARKLMGGGK